MEAMLLPSEPYDTEEAVEEEGIALPPFQHPALSAFFSDSIRAAAQTARAIDE